MKIERLPSFLQLRSMGAVVNYAIVIGIMAVIAAVTLLRVMNGPGTPPYYFVVAVVIASVLGVIFGFLGGLRNLHICRLSEELTRLVNRDRLTDVATRDFFFARLTEFPDSYGVSLMVDIDHFKQVNDSHGHQAGDQVIRAVAQIMYDQVCDQDIVCRFGGEEFVVFLHRATPVDGHVIAERIRSAIEDAPTQTTTGSINVTVSVGRAMKDRLEHVDEAIKRADRCLYRAKGLGRNRTVVDWHDASRALSA